ncbi:pantetheine-phosphate adenylyltransferase [Candidatus Aerophobetes bacterium]|uniref:Phosphopantetheine adenylyltransferase n=1 Tax=Aerophobetes bacterium TaxID=2030807 RepID=A0A523QGW4_UNCAE|nr:MAG: pantetheine-phosphate adenylyltransferase [Candidatus Aerophobetes bacterium]
MPRIAVYPGSFDPVTYGHLDIIRRSQELFDLIIVAVNDNPSRDILFTGHERIRMVKELIKDFSRVQVERFEGLLVDYAQEKGAGFIIRGLRALSDFEYEFQMNLMNRKLNPHVETIYLMTNQDYSYLSSSIIKEIVRLRGSTSGLIPESVREKLLKKMTG